MADPIFIAQPTGGQTAVSGLSQQNISDIVRRMSQQAESRTPTPTPTGSALATVSAMTGPTQTNTSGVTSAASRNQTANLQDQITAASRPFVPEIIAGYRDASGQYVPPAFTRPAQGQTIPSTLQGMAGQFDPSLIEQDPRYRLLAEQRKALEEQKAQAGQDVEAAYVAQEAALRGQQASQAGAAAMQLARMGALGTTVSGLSYLQSMDRRHLQETYDLGLQKARAVEQAKNALTNQQFDLVQQQLQVADQIQKDFEDSQARQIDRLAKYKQLQQYERADARQTLQTLVEAGITEDQLPEQYLDVLDDQQILPRGTSKQLFRLAQEERATKQIQDAVELRDKTIKQANELIGILGKTQEGGSVTIDGIDYTVLGNTDNIQSGLQIDEAGMGIAYTYDKITGRYTTQSLGKIGANKDQWETVMTNRGSMRQNRRTQEILPLTTEPNYAQAQIPDGIVWGASVGRPNAGQCGAFVNDLTGLGVGDTWESKDAKCDPTIGTNRNPIRVGDVVVQKMGTTGHVAIINDIKEVPINPNDPNSPTKTMFRLSESNMVPPNKRLTSSTRWIDQNDASITGFARGPRQPFVSGTDANIPMEGITVYTPSDIAEERAIARESRMEQRQLAQEQRALQRTIEAEKRAQEREIAKGTRVTQRPTTEPLTVYDKEMLKPLSRKEIQEYGLDPNDPNNIGINTIQLKERLDTIEANKFSDFAKKYKEQGALVGAGQIFFPTDEEVRKAWELKKQAIPTAPSILEPSAEDKSIAQNIFSGFSTLTVKDYPERQRPAIEKELSRLRQDALASGDLTGGMRATAGTGKQMIAKEREDLMQVTTVLGGIDDLIGSLRKEQTDPIVGILRTANPYDVKAKEIQARLTSISPGLARGVYGEVGVLTNADIERYQATLPNLKNTADQNKAVGLMTLKTLQRTLENNFQSFVNNNIDVSGWVPTYQNLKQRTDTLEAELTGLRDAKTNELFVVGRDGKLYALPANEYTSDQYRLASPSELQKYKIKFK